MGTAIARVRLRSLLAGFYDMRIVTRFTAYSKDALMTAIARGRLPCSLLAGFYDMCLAMRLSHRMDESMLHSSRFFQQHNNNPDARSAGFSITAIGASPAPAKRW